MVEGFVGASMAPAFDGEIGNGGAVPGADDGEERVHGHGVFDSEGVAGVEDWLSFGMDGFVEDKEVGDERWWVMIGWKQIGLVGVSDQAARWGIFVEPVALDGTAVAFGL